ncbi:MAG: microviridin/marinostatin family tricyclic proteinase inhibitor [Cyanobacteria bacterium P01_B01_bin.77]
MTQRKNSNNNASAVPFFARYLEGQVTQKLTQADLEKISGGNKEPIQTDRFPSDVDDPITMKYPSDSDEAN